MPLIQPFECSKKSVLLTVEVKLAVQKYQYKVQSVLFLQPNIRCHLQVLQWVSHFSFNKLIGFRGDNVCATLSNSAEKPWRWNQVKIGSAASCA